MRRPMLPVTLLVLLAACGDDAGQADATTTAEVTAEVRDTDGDRPDTTPDTRPDAGADTTEDVAADTADTAETIEDVPADATDTSEDAEPDTADTVDDIADVTLDTIEDVADTTGDTTPATEEITITSVACGEELLCDVQRVASGAAIGHPTMSQDLRYFAFHSANALEAADTNARDDIYVFDRIGGTYQRVSLASDGVTQGDSVAGNARMSWDGDVVVFNSESSNLAPGAGDNGGGNDTFAYVRSSARLVHLSAGLTGTQFADTPFVSGDGRWVAYRTSGVAITGVTPRQIVLYDLDDDSREVVSLTAGDVPGDGESAFAKLSYSGRLLAFESFATDLVAGDTNGKSDVFVRDLETGTIERVSVTSDGVEANDASRRPVLSADGRWVGFMSDATNLVAGDTNGKSDVYLHDRLARTTVRASILPDGTEPNGNCQPFDVSVTGRVIFYSEATGWLPGDTTTQRDMVVFDVATSALTVASSRVDGTVAKASCDVGHLTADGRWAVFNCGVNAGLVDAGSGTYYLRWLGP